MHYVRLLLVGILLLCPLGLVAADLPGVPADMPGELVGVRNNDYFTSPDADEFQVGFDTLFRGSKDLYAKLGSLTAEQKTKYTEEKILPVIDYLFGPLTTRELGSPQRTLSVDVDWARAYVKDGHTWLPYHYSGVWILDAAYAAKGDPERRAQAKLLLPVPYSERSVKTKDWKKCTESDPEYATEEFYSDFWDPARKGCGQKAGVHYAEVELKLGARTINQLETFPEYKRILSKGEFKMTFAFGYSEDVTDPHPTRDKDEGVGAYREFLRMLRKEWRGVFSEKPIHQTEYLSGKNKKLFIGHRFTGKKDGINVTVNVVVNAGIDQMELFAKSFAHDHDDVFAWFGHSREGLGFEEGNFAKLLKKHPEYYSVSDKFQLIYWDSCNSYTYYTYSFFKFKSEASGGADPKGTRNLNIISNGMPSLFALGAKNARSLSHYLLNWQEHASYQTILSEIRASAEREKSKVFVSVLGDEDNEER